MAEWLLKRLFDSTNQSEPHFALQATINWMRALAVFVEDGSFEDEKIKAYYESTNRRKVNHDADTLVFENMLMAFHNQAALASLTRSDVYPYDVCRSAIVNWYYSAYFAGSAMIAATSGSKQENHSETAKVWQTDIVNPKLVMPPFSLSLNSLVKKDCEREALEYRQNNSYNINTYPENEEQAWGAMVAYLKGTGEYKRKQVEALVKDSQDYKKLGVSGFRTQAAREIRDRRLRKNTVNYLSQAFRYRGKANYRDSIFLSYGNDESAKMKVFVQDLEKVSGAFQRMAAHYICRRIERDTWSKFVADLEENSRLSIEVQYLAI